MRISDWSSDVCSSDLGGNEGSIDRNIGWWLDRVHPDDHLSLKAASKNAFERREAEWTANFRLKTSRGRYIPVLLRGFHVYAASGNLERIIATAIDLSVVNEIGRAHVRTPVTNAQLDCILLLE